VLFQGARETREDFGSVDGGGTRPYAGLEGFMGIKDRTTDVIRVGRVDTAPRSRAWWVHEHSLSEITTVGLFLFDLRADVQARRGICHGKPEKEI